MSKRPNHQGAHNPNALLHSLIVGPLRLGAFFVALTLVACGGPDFAAFGATRPDSDIQTTPPSDDAGTGAGGAPVRRELVKPPPTKHDAGDEAADSAGSAGGAAGATSGAGGSLPIGVGVNMNCPDPVTHSDGFGHTWIDCVPLGTYDAKQAAKACRAYTGGPDNCYNSPGCGTAPWVVQAIGPSYNIIWGYTGDTAGFVGIDGACPNGDNGKVWR